MQIKFDISKMTIGDFEKIEKCAHGGSFSDGLDALQKATEVNIRELPLSEMRQLFATFSESIKADEKAKN
jgi:hypothetical protein